MVDAELPGFRFVGPVDHVGVNRAAKAAWDVSAFVRVLSAAFHEHPIVRAVDIEAFVNSRNLYINLLAPSEPHLLWLHTVPQTIGTGPWILHIEHPTLLFFPVLSHGNTANIELRSLPIYWLVRYLLEQRQCKAIFSHLHETAENLGRIFDSQIIASKTHYIKLGLCFTPDQHRKIAEARARHPARDITILFTNSWHGNPKSFLVRGGIDLVHAFDAAARRVPNLKLILRTRLPSYLGSTQRELIWSHPGITLIDKRISDDDLIGLYSDASIFAIPSFGLHSCSTLRGMYCGAVCVASDAPGYEELIDNGVTGYCLAGRRDRIYSVDPETGWLRDSFSPIYEADIVYADRLARLIVEIAQCEELRERITRAARFEAKISYDPVNALGAFSRLVKSALGICSQPSSDLAGAEGTAVGGE